MLKTYWPYILVFGGLFGALAFFNSKKKPELRWSKTYKGSDKIPFGSNALIRLMEDGAFEGRFETKNIPILQSNDIKKDTGVTYFFLTDRLYFDQYETERIVDFASRGNKLFLCANHFDGVIADTFKVFTEADLPYLDERRGAIDSSDTKEFGINFLNPHLRNKESYRYDHLLGYSTFTYFDSTKMSVVAADDSNRAVLIKNKCKKGEIYFFTLPDVFSNYYIVNHPSRFFTYKTLSLMNNEKLWWDEYYKTSNPHNNGAFHFLVYNDALYYAFWLALWSVLFFMFFGMKRQQRPVPIIKPHANSTLQFVEVVGNVYFNAKNHKIIAEEKILIFFEFIRTKFQVKTENITEEDLKRVSRLSGITQHNVNELFANIKYIYAAEHLHEAELLQFNKRMEDFYKNNNR
ncbi:MAG: DUF4350 domain-containing protein [Bacteroidia bacterium]|nr:DUF4350 domain-containing protein [Bacteroidia bacterium]